MEANNLHCQVFNTHVEAEAAIRTLSRAGIDIKKISLVGMLVGALEGAVVVGGVSALLAALTQIGMSKEQAITYESDLKADRFVLMVHGDQADADQVASLVHGSHAWETA